jgi:NADP-dependent 3-hydroxy acid dehydrogenase YdfG
MSSSRVALLEWRGLWHACSSGKWQGLLVDIREENLEKTQSEVAYLVNIKANVCDISDKNKVYELTEKVKTKLETIDILVNNEGVVRSNPFQDKPDAVIERTIAMNLPLLSFGQRRPSYRGRWPKGRGMW